MNYYMLINKRKHKQEKHIIGQKWEIAESQRRHKLVCFLAKKYKKQKSAFIF